MRTGIFAVVALLWLAAPVRADRAEALYKEGMALQNQGKVDEAISAFEKCVTEEPKHVMAWASLGKLYKKKEQFEKSAVAYEHATALAPREAPLWGNLGYAYYHLGKDDQALEALMKSCKLDHNNAQVSAFIGSIRSRKGDIKGAIGALRWAVKLDGGNADYHNNLGVAYRKDKNYPKAIESFKKALALKDDAQYHFDLAVVYRVQEEIDDAIVHYEAAVKLDPKMAPAWYDLGIMYKANHNDPKAVEAWEMYLKVTGGKTKESDQVKQEIEAAGGTPVKKRKGN